MCLPRAAGRQRRRRPLSDLSISPWVARIPASREILSRHFASWIALHWLWQGFPDAGLSQHRLLQRVYSDCRADHANLATPQSMPDSLLTDTAGFRELFRYLSNKQRNSLLAQLCKPELTPIGADGCEGGRLTGWHPLSPGNFNPPYAQSSSSTGLHPHCVAARSGTDVARGRPAQYVQICDRTNQRVTPCSRWRRNIRAQVAGGCRSRMWVGSCCAALIDPDWWRR